MSDFGKFVDALIDKIDMAHIPDNQIRRIDGEQMSDQDELQRLRRENAALKAELALRDEAVTAWKDLANKYESAIGYRCYHCDNVYVGDTECQNHFGEKGQLPKCIQADLEQQNAELKAELALYKPRQTIETGGTR